ncbi:hypothetical protein CesoFtcFv8_009991 [Champsocephalus esox]|uniref:Uncharacterized protein n=1 Tax=Champsocephalus esox TaxID=159716 RepID=A0AAN8H2C4_9TELE|nr:hypothetical protein CesoFtcFv8_009991 [Champsocephalus esox]
MEGGGSGKEMCPLSETEHQVAGSGLEAFEDDPWSLRWDGLSHRSGQKWRGGEPGAPREPADHADYWRGPSLAAPSHITAQTARVYWLHPNKQANTDDSLVHKTLNRHHMRTIGRSYTEEQRKIWV